MSTCTTSDKEKKNSQTCCGTTEKHAKAEHCDSEKNTQSTGSHEKKHSCGDTDSSECAEEDKDACCSK